LGQACNHIAALLFYIEHHAHDDELPTEKSQTSLPMKWNQPPKKIVAPDCASNMNFIKPSHGDDPEGSGRWLNRSTFDPRIKEHQVVDKQALDKLLSRVQKSVPLQQFFPVDCFSSSVGAELLWRHVIFSHAHASTVAQERFFNPTLSQAYNYLSDMKLEPDEVAKIEEATRGQSDNNLWFALRNGRLTSSRFGEIFHRRESTDPRRLVRDIMGYGGPIKCLPPQIRWGQENEEEARRCYINNREAAGETMVVKESGLHLIPDKAYLGASSDGLVTCTSVDLCCQGCLEIKCPYSIDKVITVEMSPMEIAERFGDKFFMKKGKDGELHLPKQHKYYTQVQGELAIIDREWCDFVVYSNGQVVVDRILADLEYWATIEHKLEEFYVHNVVPEILSGTIFLEDYGSFL